MPEIEPSVFALQQSFPDHCIQPVENGVRFTTSFSKGHLVHALADTIDIAAYLAVDKPTVYQTLCSLHTIFLAGNGAHIAVYAFEERETSQIFTIMQTKCAIAPQQIPIGNEGLSAPDVINVIRCASDNIHGQLISTRFTGYPIVKPRLENGMGHQDYAKLLLRNMKPHEQQLLMIVLLKTLFEAQRYALA